MTALLEISRMLAAEVEALHFAPPVTHVYNPLRYARLPHEAYLRRYGNGEREVVMLGMNPGPFGMAQTGVPFGDPEMVRDWLGIEEPVGPPENPHPRRPIEGFACRRHEVSGQRLWGWARARWETPERFFARFFVMNYCPLVFMEASGKIFTPDKLPASERQALFACCDRALRAASPSSPRASPSASAISPSNVCTPSSAKPLSASPASTHPSPANPQANRGWDMLADGIMAELGIRHAIT